MSFFVKNKFNDASTFYAVSAYLRERSFYFHDGFTVMTELSIEKRDMEKEKNFYSLLDIVYKLVQAEGSQEKYLSHYLHQSTINKYLTWFDTTCFIFSNTIN